MDTSKSATVLLWFHKEANRTRYCTQFITRSCCCLLVAKSPNSKNVPAPAGSSILLLHRRNNNWVSRIPEAGFLQRCLELPHTRCTNILASCAMRMTPEIWSTFEKNKCIFPWCPGGRRPAESDKTGIVRAGHEPAYGDTQTTHSLIS